MEEEGGTPSFDFFLAAFWLLHEHRDAGWDSSVSCWGGKERAVNKKN